MVVNGFRLPTVLEFHLFEKATNRRWSESNSKQLAKWELKTSTSRPARDFGSVYQQ